MSKSPRFSGIQEILVPAKKRQDWPNNQGYASTFRSGRVLHPSRRARHRDPLWRAPSGGCGPNDPGQKLIDVMARSLPVLRATTLRAPGWEEKGLGTPPEGRERK